MFQLIMPGRNCAIYGCSSSRTSPGVSIFNVSSSEEEINSRYHHSWQSHWQQPPKPNSRLLFTCLWASLSRRETTLTQVLPTLMKFIIILSDICTTTIDIRNEHIMLHSYGYSAIQSELLTFLIHVIQLIAITSINYLLLHWCDTVYNQTCLSSILFEKVNAFDSDESRTTLRPRSLPTINLSTKFISRSK